MLKTGMYIIAFIILCSISNIWIDYSIEKEINDRSPYYLSFASIGAISLESRLDCWAKINTSSTSQDLKQNMLTLLNCLEIPAETDQLQFETNHNNSILRYDFTKDKENIRLTFATNQKKNESYYMLSFSSRNKVNKFDQYRDVIEAYHENGIKWTYYYQYTGEIAGQISSSDSQQNILKVIMKNLAAKEEKVYRQGNILTVTGFSPNITNVIPAVGNQGQKYNVEAQIRNDKTGRTLVCIGSPVIMASY